MTGYIRNLSPYDQSAFIAEIIKILRMLIMRKTNRICAHLTNQINIFLMMLIFKGVTDAGSILMAGNAAQRIRLAVKEKAFICVKMKGTATEFAGNFIKHFIVFNDLCAGGV